MIFLKFADSVYKTPPSVEYWEKQNLHGSMILMEGSKTGSAKVTVKPLDPAYKEVRVAIQFPQKYFLVKMSSSNGTYQEIRTLIPGSTVINAHLLGIAKKCLAPNSRAIQNERLDSLLINERMYIEIYSERVA
ncbi:nuclear pore membrane glycoprotein 210 [Trichonephila clavipes]|nr:nuclear pore membrane glycoprotein 210 [Trichonephila clavipes]